GMGTHDRRARATRPRAARADPLRRRRAAARPPPAPATTAPTLGTASPAGNERGGVHRGGPRGSRRGGWRSAVLRASGPALAVLPRSQALLGQAASRLAPYSSGSIQCADECSSQCVALRAFVAWWPQWFVNANRQSQALRSARSSARTAFKSR